MKRILAMLLALVLLLTLCGCEETGASHEAPEPTDYEVVRNALLENFEQAQKQYTGSQIEWNVPVTRIEKDFSGGTVTDRCMVLRAPTWYAGEDGVNFRFYLSQEEMKSLELGQVVRVKGRIDEIWLDGKTPQVEVKDASIVTDTFHVSGKISYIDTFEGRPYCCFIDNDVIPVGTGFIVFLPEDHGYSYGDVITLDAKLTVNYRVDGIKVEYDSSYKRTSMSFFLDVDDYTVVE